MTDLGKAYVQIMPSAQGIKGQVEKILGKDLDGVAESSGKSMGKRIASGLGTMGSTLTKSITLPVAGAVTAIGGIVGALGWGRLTGLDSARAQLQGLGYDAEAVERISSLVNEAIQGTTTTMADGVSTAAGALAAGVAEGAELERYIKLVGDAAVGAGRDTGDMAQIFNRVQGSGKLMTQELNMIEDGMPGFAQAMADSLGVPQDEFRAMVTAGEVSSTQFLDVMESFAGDMSDAYAGSWAGIVSRTKSNIGILGETMLSGVFEQSKESLAEFLEFIRTDDVRGWFADAGQAMGQVFTNVLETIKGAIQWWGNLDDSVKENIFTIGGIIIAAGPVLTILSKLIGVVMGAQKGFGMAKTAAGFLSGAIGAISAPVAIVIGAIAGLVAGFVYLWQTNEEFRTAVIEIWNNIKDMLILAWDTVIAYLQPAIQAVVNFVMEIFGGLVEWWSTNQQMITDAAINAWNFISGVIEGVMSVIWAIMQTIWPLIEAVVRFAWDGIKNIIQGAINIITGIIEFFSALFTGNWSALWESVKRIVSGVVQAIWGFIQLWIVGKIIGAVKAFAGLLKSVISGAWNFVKNIFSSSLSWIWGKVSSIFGSISSFIQGIMSTIRNVISGGLNAVKGFFSNIFGSLRGIVSGAFNSVRTAISSGMSRALSTITRFFSRFKTAGSNLIGNIADGIKGAIGKVTGAVSGVLQKARDLLPFSPPKDKSSPLVDIHKNGIGEQIAKGILGGQSEVEKAMNDLLSLPEELMSGTLHSDLAMSTSVAANNLAASGNLNNETDNRNMQKLPPIYLNVNGKVFAELTEEHFDQVNGMRLREIERGWA